MLTLGVLGKMASQAVRDFCTATREAEALRTRRCKEKKQASEARRAAEQLLLESLREGETLKTSIDDVTFAVCVRRRRSFPSFSSSLVERVRVLWRDPGALRRQLEEAEADSALGAAEAVLFRAAGGEPRSRLALCLGPLRGEGEYQELSREHGELVGVLVRSRQELASGKEEHLEDARRIDLMKKEAESTLIRELAQLGPGEVKRVSMLDVDGASACFYLRLKSARAAAKRKITAKALNGYIRQALQERLGPLRTNELLVKFCDPAFGESFLDDLKVQLCKHEQQERAAAPRVALDRIRGQREAPAAAAQGASIA